MIRFWYILLTIVLLQLYFASSTKTEDEIDDDIAYAESMLSTAELIEARGFLAEDHSVTTGDGYILNLVRAKNPLCGNNESKSVVLFIHGIHSYANQFLLKAFKAKPRDYCRLNVSSFSQEELQLQLANDSSRNSLPFMLMNFGHEVWLLNRRGTPQSRRRTNGRHAMAEYLPNGRSIIEKTLKIALAEISLVGPSPVLVTGAIVWAQFQIVELLRLIGEIPNIDYWDYSLDEQVEFDFMDTIDYIRSIVGDRKVSVVGHSAGGAITILALARKPKIAHKLGQVILWSPSVNLGHHPVELVQDILAQKSLSHYHGPEPPIIASEKLRQIFGQACHGPAKNKSVCVNLFEAWFGKSGKYRKPSSIFLYNLFVPTSTNEVVHIVQSAQTGGIQHYYDYGHISRNLEHYGTTRPPAYNFSAIICNSISLYAGETDFAVRKEDVMKTHELLDVPASFKVLVPEDKIFNHDSYMANDNIYSLLHIENLMKIERQTNFL